MRLKLSLHQFEVFIGNFLRYGVLICALVIGTGILLSFLFPTNLDPPLSQFIAEILQGKRVEVPLFTTFSNPNTIISLGLLMLIALPILRVALTFVVFVLEGDYVYMTLTAVVLAVLLVGLFFGKEL